MIKITNIIFICLLILSNNAYSSTKQLNRREKKALHIKQMKEIFVNSIDARNNPLLAKSVYLMQYKAIISINNKPYNIKMYNTIIKYLKNNYSFKQALTHYYADKVNAVNECALLVQAINSTQPIAVGKARGNCLSLFKNKAYYNKTKVNNNDPILQVILYNSPHNSKIINTFFKHTLNSKNDTLLIRALYLLQDSLMPELNTSTITNKSTILHIKKILNTKQTFAQVLSEYKNNAPLVIQKCSLLLQAMTTSNFGSTYKVVGYTNTKPSQYCKILFQSQKYFETNQKVDLNSPFIKVMMHNLISISSSLQIIQNNF